jgi:hypothetical protein
MEPPKQSQFGVGQGNLVSNTNANFTRKPITENLTTSQGAGISS